MTAIADSFVDPSSTAAGCCADDEVAFEEEIPGTFSELGTMGSSPARNQRVESIVKRELEAIQEVFRIYHADTAKIDAARVQCFQNVQTVLPFHDFIESGKGYVRPEGEWVGALKLLNRYAYLYLHLPPSELISTANAYRSLALSTSKDPALRQFSPEATGAGTVNGTYFLPTSPESLGMEISSLKGSRAQRSFVLKPSQQEAGTVGNPGGNQTVKNAIRGGEGAIRERFAYSAQKHLGLDLGIPFTEVIPASHTLLGSLMGQSINLLQMFEKTIDTKTELDIARFIFENPQINTIEQILPILFQAIERVVSGDQEKEKKLKIFVGIFNAFLTDPNIRKIVIVKKIRAAGLSQAEHPELMSNASRFIDILKMRDETPPMCSIQQFKSGTKVYAHYDQGVLEAIPDEEMHKVAVADILLFNMDRHMNNVLFLDQVDSTPKLILIDHGLSLPHTDDGRDLVHAARYEWIQYSQFNHPLHPSFAEAISRLDIETYISRIKADHDTLARVFGPFATITEESYMLLRLNLHLLKVGARLHVPVRNISLFHQSLRIDQKDIGGEAGMFFEQHLSGKRADQVDWGNIEKILEEILLKPEIERIMPS